MYLLFFYKNPWFLRIIISKSVKKISNIIIKSNTKDIDAIERYN
jgi:hypothetical protein